MQKKKQNKNNTIKEIILYILLVVIILLITFSEDIIKLANKNKINLAENSEIELIINEPNPPQLSAGMIPVKWNGTNWIITTAKDNEWYDYKNGKPAYIMLNDGYYQSELIRDMSNKELAENNVGVGVPDDPSIRGTIFMWIPRFAYKETGEIGYIKEETTPGGEWTVPEMFSYAVSDETKPDFSLSGIWVEKDVDTEFAEKITEMQKEEGIYGFLAHTKPRQITSTDINTIQKFTAETDDQWSPLQTQEVNSINENNTVGNDASVDPQTDTTNTVGAHDCALKEPTNSNRIILQIVNTSKHEPIKANVIHNTTEERLEIRVTYTSNGISKILDEYGEEMTLTQTNGITYADTGNVALITGTYLFTIIDNIGNKRELSIDLINSLYNVAYINRIDNMNNTATYIKTQETKTTDETELLNEISTIDTSTTYSRAIKDTNEAITAITQIGRTAEDDQLYLYGKYKANSKKTYYAEKSNSKTTAKGLYRNSGSNIYWSTDNGNVSLYSNYSLNSNTGTYTMGNLYVTKVVGATGYIKKNNTLYYAIVTKSISVNGNYTYEVYFDIYEMKIKYNTTYSRGSFVSNLIAQDGTYTIGSTTKVHSDGYWYVRDNLLPKYTLQKYDRNLNLQSTYDVDTAILTTVPINISNKGNNKVKLTLNTSGTNYKTYISNDNTNWQELTDITSGTPKELEVDGWDNLYIKIETNTSTINNIDVAYYKD